MSGGLTAPGFWWRQSRSAAAWLLAPVGWLYGQIAGYRMQTAPRGRADVPVICIGNFVTGGTGKTPFCLALAALLAQEGRRPVFLLRGYGGRLSGPVRVDPSQHDSLAVGDEALLLAVHGPTVIAADRVAGAQLAQTLGDVIVMDDGFQNPALHKSVSLALVDGTTGVGNGMCLPAGPLRAPLGLQLQQADALVVIGAGIASDPVQAKARSLARPVFRARLTPCPQPELAGRCVLAFAGIGRPEKAFETLRALGADIVEQRAFGDHHAYTEADASELLGTAERRGLTLMTTAKDMARLSGAASPALRELATRARVFEVDMRLEEPQALMRFLRPNLRDTGANATD